MVKSVPTLDAPDEAIEAEGPLNDDGGHAAAVRHLASELDLANADKARLHAALGALVRVLDQAVPHLNNALATLKLAGVSYLGPIFEKELTEARTSVREIAPPRSVPPPGAN